MEEYFAAKPISNTSILCVGGITRTEADLAKEEGMEISGLGYYLFLASQDEPRRPIEILAQFASESAAEKLARLFARTVAS